MLGSLHDDRPDNNDSSEVGAGAGVGAPGRALAAPASPRGIVLACADLLHRGDLPAARRAADTVLAAASPLGDATDRLAHQFARALALRIDSDKRTDPGAAAVSAVAYLAFNQIVPFLRFSHLTANQAILEAVDGARRVHVIDLDAAYGVQWPPLLQAIADRADPALGPPEVRITGAGADREVLLRTGDRLHAFASSLHLPFRFHPLLLSCTAQIATTSVTNLELHPDEALAVNCVLFLHKLRGDDELAAFLKWVKGMHPAVVTIAEREGSDASNHHTDDLPRRVAVAMEYYAPVFDALEATVPPGNRDRLAVEQEVLGREIDEAVAAGPRPWWRGLERCGAAARVAGLAPRPLSAFAVSQARLLLRLHYPSEGYVVQEARGACFLGWQTRPLMSVSSWQ